MSTIRQVLYGLCEQYITEREAAIRKTIDEIREAASNETKSSAGDKYETARETMQQDIDMNLMRLNELMRLRQTLERIVPDNKSNTVIPGSVVYTNNGKYYIAISAGVLRVDNEKYYAVSAASPIGELLSGKEKGNEFVFNGKHHSIEQVL